MQGIGWLFFRNIHGNLSIIKGLYWAIVSLKICCKAFNWLIDNLIGVVITNQFTTSEYGEVVNEPL